MVMLVRPLHPLNESFEMRFTELGMITVDSAIQSRKADAPIIVTDSPMMILDKLLQFWKA